MPLHPAGLRSSHLRLESFHPALFLPAPLPTSAIQMFTTAAQLLDLTDSKTLQPPYRPDPERPRLTARASLL